MPKRKPQSPTRPTPPPSEPAVTARRSPLLWIVPLVVLLLVGVGGLLWWLAQTDQRRATQANARIGGAADCRTLPKFPASVGFPGGVLLSTSQRQTKGLVMFEQHASQQDATGQPRRRSYQAPSWTQAGWLGAPVIDQFGNVFVAPAPFISLLDNPPDKQNIIYRVDTNTGEMKPFATLPAAAPPVVDNPFGILGMTYDCDTSTLYAASVSGSTRDNVVGRLFHIDATTGAILAQRDGIDGFGLAVFHGGTGKRLYYGLARASEVHSIALDDQGNFSGDPRVELSLANQGPRGDDRARRIDINSAGELVVRGMSFDFNLVAPSELQQTAYHFQYDRAKDSWSLMGSEPVQDVTP